MKGTNSLRLWMPDPLINRFSTNLIIKGSVTHMQRPFVLLEISSKSTPSAVLHFTVLFQTSIKSRA